MKKAIIIGINGAGKSYFSKKLAEKTGLPLVHLDNLYWRDNWERISSGEFDELLGKELARDEWIIDGNFQRTMEWRMDECDTVFYFDFSTLRGLCGVLGRMIKNGPRDDIGGNNTNRLNLPFMRDVISFNKSNRKKTRALIAAHPQVKTVVFKNRKQAERYLRSLDFPARG